MSGPPELPPAGVPPEEAIAFFRSKDFRIGFNWQDVFKIEHVRWFTVAKAMSRDVLEDIRAAVDAAIADGTTLADFKKTLRPKLQAKGWWGKKPMIDPLTAENKIVQLGSERRLKTIFNTNLRTAYQAGKWERIQRTKAAFPYLEYSAVMDGRERPQHHAWDGTILPADDPWWDTHYGPCDWNCRCTAVQRSARAMERLGLSVTETPVTFPPEPWTNTRTGETGTLEGGIGKGWDYNVGKEYLRGLAPSPMPESFGGTDEVGAGVAGEQYRTAQLALVDRFLKNFGVKSGAEAIWTDRDGWPLAIERSWFLGQNKDVRLPKGTAAGVLLDRIAAAIVTPDAIRWIWVRAESGRALLFRRYTRRSAGLVTTVDIGGVGWRWSVAQAEDVAAQLNAHQSRYGAGGPRGGQFRATHGTALRESLAGDQRPVRKALIGVVSDSTSNLTARINIDTRDRKVALTHSYSVKILNKHGVGKEADPRQVGVTINDIFRAASFLERSIDISPDPRGRSGRHGQDRFEARIPHNRLTYHMVFEVNARDITLVTMFKRR